MRRAWIGLTLAGVLPAVLFYLLRAAGLTEALRYVSTTGWRPGAPSPLDLFLMFASMITWSWVRGFVWLFLGAALPFALADLWTSARRPAATEGDSP